MHFKNFALITFLLLTLLGSQSFSNCNPAPPPDPGLNRIHLSVKDNDGQDVQYALIGLLGYSELNDSRYRPFDGCLIDTFYTDIQGNRDIDYLSDKYNYFWLVVLPDNGLSSSKTSIDSKDNQQINITAHSTQSAQYLLRVHVKKQNFDSITLHVNHIIDKDIFCKENGLDLSQIPLSLDTYTAKAIMDSSLMKVIPNQSNNLLVDFYKNGEMVQDTLIQLEVADTIVNVQIN